MTNICSDSALDPKTPIRRLLLRCKPEYPALFRVPETWFETFEGHFYLRLNVHQEKYVPQRTMQAAPTYVDTLTTQVAPSPLVRLGFDATVTDPEFGKLMLVERIGFDCTTPNRRRHVPVTLIDFVRPEVEDWLDKTTGEVYTVRTGRIIELNESAGTVGTGQKLYGKGFVLKFQERGKRRRLG
jgi:hypothetical protein